MPYNVSTKPSKDGAAITTKLTIDFTGASEDVLIDCRTTWGIGGEWIAPAESPGRLTAGEARNPEEVEGDRTLTSAGTRRPGGAS